MNAQHLLRDAIRPALIQMGIGGTAAEELVLGTAMVESNLQYLRQLKGPALGFWQMEPGTHSDIYKNYLAYQDDFRASLLGLTLKQGETPEEHALQMTWNLRYGAAMCRLKYYRSPRALPEAGDLEAQAGYWKDIYNTHLGAGTVEHYIQAWKSKM